MICMTGQRPSALALLSADQILANHDAAGSSGDRVGK